MSGMDRIVGERQRQITEEGYTEDHDDLHPNGALLFAAEAYLRLGLDLRFPRGNPPSFWPWHEKFWKPKDKARNLERAGALLIAEKDRIQRRVEHIAHLLDEMEAEEG